MVIISLLFHRPRVYHVKLLFIRPETDYFAILYDNFVTSISFSVRRELFRMKQVKARVLNVLLAIFLYLTLLIVHLVLLVFHQWRALAPAWRA